MKCFIKMCKLPTLFLLIFAVLTACNPKNENEVVGTYIFENPQERDVIELERSHDYKRTIFVKSDGRSTVEKGTWKLEVEGTAKVTLYFNERDSLGMEMSTKAMEKWFGRLYLGSGEDGARQYRKTD